MSTVSCPSSIGKFFLWRARVQWMLMTSIVLADFSSAASLFCFWVLLFLEQKWELVHWLIFFTLRWVRKFDLWGHFFRTHSIMGTLNALADFLFLCIFCLPLKNILKNTDSIISWNQLRVDWTSYPHEFQKTFRLDLYFFVLSVKNLDGYSRLVR